MFSRTLAQVADYFETHWGISTATQIKLLWTLLIFTALPLISSIILAIFRHRAKEPTQVYKARVVLRYSTGILILLLLVFIWASGGGLASLATYLGILSAGLIIALQDAVSNLAGFVFIMWRKPFSLGDRIEIGGLTGDVVDIRAFQFTVVEVGNWVDADQSTGRIVHVPNMQAMKLPVANYTIGFEYIWHEIPVLVTFESDWRLAKQLLRDVAAHHCQTFTPQAAQQLRKAAQRYMIVTGALTPIVYTRVADCGVLLTLRYLTHARRRRSTEEVIWEAILAEFEQHENIDYAYPTVRYYDNRGEGKPGARAE